MHSPRPPRPPQSQRDLPPSSGEGFLQQQHCSQNHPPSPAVRSASSCARSHRCRQSLPLQPQPQGATRRGRQPQAGDFRLHEERIKKAMIPSSATAGINVMERVRLMHPGIRFLTRFCMPPLLVGLGRLSSTSSELVDDEIRRSVRIVPVSVRGQQHVMRRRRNTDDGPLTSRAGLCV